MMSGSKGGSNPAASGGAAPAPSPMNEFPSAPGPVPSFVPFSGYMNSPMGQQRLNPDAVNPFNGLPDQMSPEQLDKAQKEYWRQQNADPQRQQQQQMPPPQIAPMPSVQGGMPTLQDLLVAAARKRSGGGAY